MTQNYLERKYHLRTSDFDMRSRILPASVLDLFQDAAGEHAKVLNAIVRDIKELKFKPAKRFKELLGHTRSEVMWGMVTGIVWATLFCWIFD